MLMLVGKKEVNKNSKRIRGYYRQHTDRSKTRLYLSDQHHGQGRIMDLICTEGEGENHGSNEKPTSEAKRKRS
jgi:hypothetical protein